MLLILSPSKTQDFEQSAPFRTATQPAFLPRSRELIASLRRLSAAEIGKLMDISDKLAHLNYERYRAFSPPFTVKNAKQAMFAFHGDVYDGLAAATLPPKAIEFAQKHLRILSGLYGVLKPLDLIQPYRLEMKTRVKSGKTKDLYDFWGTSLTDFLKEELAAQNNNILINLASEEYASVINPKRLGATIITPQFKEKKGKEYKMIGLFAKRARGAMARYIVTQALTAPAKLTRFAEDGYTYNPALSTDTKPVFTRG